jgi:hypothetical protein
MLRSCRVAAAFVLAATVLGTSTQARAAKPVLAVFDVYDARPKGKFNNQELQQLTLYLMAKLAEGEVFSVVPRDQVVAAISGQKKDSYKACYDEQCQIELGKELAAEKSLGTQIIRIGDRCVITSTLYDLKTAVSERAATQRAKCGQNEISDALEMVVEKLNNAGPAKAQVVVNTGDKTVDNKGTGKGTERPYEEPRDTELKPPHFEDSSLNYLQTSDGKLCAGGDGEACARVASENGSTRLAWKHADRGCQMAHSPSCQWAAKVALDLGEKETARQYAKYACLKLNDPSGCMWYARIEQEIGSKAKALEIAVHNCTARQSGSNCAWAANISYNTGNKNACREYARKGCGLGDAEACSWIVKLEYEGRNMTAAFSMAQKGCNELKHGSSCSWAGTIQYETNNKVSALEYSGKGCDLGDATACEWNAKINYELGYKERALEVGSKACGELRSGVACTWAASIDYEFGNRAKGLDWAIKGCAYGSPDSCNWQRRIQGELNP